MDYTQGTSPTWLRQVATALSSRYNVTIREGRGWAMDVDKKVLIYKSEHLLALDRDTCLGILLHELGHLHFTKNDWTDTAKLYKDYPLKNITFSAINFYEDVRVNEKMSQSYQGSRDLIDAMNELLAGDGVGQILKMNESCKAGRPRANFNMPEYHEIFYISMCKLLGNSFPSFMPDAYYDKHKLELVNEIVAEAERIDLRNHVTTQEVYDFYESFVYPRIKSYLPEVDKSGDEGGGDKGGDEAGDDGGGNAGGDSGSTEGEKPDAPKPEGGKGEGDKSDDGKGTGEASKEDDKKKGGDKGTRGGDGFDLDQWKRDLEEKIEKAVRRGRINPDEQHKTDPFGSERSRLDVEQPLRKICNVDDHMEESNALQRRFSNKFETLFRDNQYKRETRNQRSGRLDKHSLHKFATGKTRLFKRKLDTNKKSYAVAFLMDLSGSMWEEQIRGSFHAMLAFSTTLQKLQIPYGIGFFSHETSIGKHFKDRKITNLRVGKSASQVLNGGTQPDELLKSLCAKELAQQQVKEKIVVILTDGMWGRESYECLRTLKKNNADFHIYLVGLGLQEQHVERIEPEIEGVATLLISDTTDGIVERYLEIAKKHLL